jgi:hypothetical protein
VCLHPNKWKGGDVDAFSRNLDLHADRVTDVRALLERFGGRRASVLDHSFRAQRRTKKAVRLWLRRRRSGAA